MFVEQQIKSNQIQKLNNFLVQINKKTQTAIPTEKQLLINAKSD